MYELRTSRDCPSHACRGISARIQRIGTKTAGIRDEQPLYAYPGLTSAQDIKNQKHVNINSKVLSWDYDPGKNRIIQKSFLNTRRGDCRAYLAEGVETARKVALDLLRSGLTFMETHVPLEVLPQLLGPTSGALNVAMAGSDMRPQTLGIGEVFHAAGLTADDIDIIQFDCGE